MNIVVTESVMNTRVDQCEKLREWIMFSYVEYRKYTCDVNYTNGFNIFITFILKFIY